MYIYTGENGIYQLGVNFDNIAKDRSNVEQSEAKKF